MSREARWIAAAVLLAAALGYLGATVWPGLP